jgi:putative spermidine/putrescine transport system permease protein
MRTAKKRTFVTAFLLLSLIFPLIVLILWSFSQGWSSKALLPSALGLRGWAYLISPYSKVLPSLGISVLISVSVTSLALFISIPAGKALGQYEFPGKRFVEVLVLAPIIIPTITVGLGIHVLFIRYGLADTLLGVVLVHLPVVLPYGIRIFASCYKALGTKWEEQGKVLKCSKWQTFLYITLPFLYPGIVSAGVLMFNVSFSQYFLTYLIGGGNIITLPLLLFPFVNSGDRVIASSLSLIFVATSLFMMVLVEKTIQDKEQQTNFYYL